MANTPRFKIRTLVLASLATAAAFLPIATAAQACARLADWIMQPAPKGGVLGSTTLTGLIPDLYEALDVVSREMVGMIPSVMLDAQAARAALNQDVRSPVAPAATASDITPGVTPPDDGNQTIGNVSVRVTKARRVPIRWTGEQQRQANSGPGYQNIRASQFAQAMRTLCNEMESDLAALHVECSRAAGAAGTTPFGTAGDYIDAANVRRILNENGAPMADRSLVLDSVAAANMVGKQARWDVQNDTTILRQGVMLDASGLALRESGQIRTFTKGTAASATTNTAGYAIGATTITLASAGTGTILAGDVITFAGDANQYVVLTGDPDVSNGGTITLTAPGLRRAIPASATNITVVNTSVRSMGFSRNAIVLAARLPSLPEEGDIAVDRMLVTDPRSGMSFELALYPQYRQMQMEISAAWGVKMVKPEHAAVLLG